MQVNAAIPDDLVEDEGPPEEEAQVEDREEPLESTAFEPSQADPEAEANR